MTFHNVQLDPTISLGAIGGPAYGTTIQTTASGHEYRVARQSRARRRYRFSKSLLPASEWSALVAFWQARRGHLHSFRYKDWADYSTGPNDTEAPTSLDVILGSGDGARQDFQLLKTYDASGLNPYTEAITLPVSGTVVVSVAGTPTTAFTVSTTTGIVTMNTAPTLGQVVRAGCYFDRNVRFDTANEWLAQRFSGPTVADFDSLECVELLDEVEIPERRDMGGAEAVETDQDVLVTYDAAFWDIDNTSGGAIDVWLPSPDRIPGGPCVFVIHNNSASTGNLQIRDDAANTVGSAFGAGVTRRVALSRNGGTATWVAYA